MARAHVHERVAAAADHHVHVYGDAADLAGPVAAHLAAGLDASEPVVAIVTPEHWAAIAGRLAAAGRDVDALLAEGLLVVADADTTLDALLDGGQLSPRRFEEVVGGLIDCVAAGPPRRVCAFGEMVDLLVRRGDPTAAAELEDLWNRLARRRDLSLLCAYGVDVFDRDAQLNVLPHVWHAHAGAVASEEAERMHDAVDAALGDVLGRDAEKVYALVAAQVREDVVPRSQLVLMWVSAHMPRTAERVLAAARAHYALATR
jgi:hypothetical protein